MATEERSRRIEAEIEIDASPDAVWRALTEGEEISRWFAFEARSEPRLGGEVWLSWGPPWEATSRITLWEPNRRVQMTDERVPESFAHPTPLVVDYHLEARGGKTVLRLVHSGFAASGWDEEFDAIHRGWQVFLRGLAHYLTRHRGTPRRVAYAMVGRTRPHEEAWQSLTGPRGLAREGSLAGLAEGGRYEVVTATGDRLAGVVQVWNPPKDLAATVENLGDAHLWLECGLGHVSLTLSTFGLPAAELAAIEGRWREMLARLFGP